MNNTKNVYNKYAQNNILTASPAKLVLIMYDGIIKFCNIAINAIENKNIEESNNNIIKAQKIITELRCSLDFNYPVANDFENVYKYVNDKLVQANIKKDKEILEEVIKHIKTMKETWKEVMEITKK
jgi:flagellar protein FliS